MKNKVVYCFDFMSVIMVFYKCVACVFCNSDNKFIDLLYTNTI